MNRKRLLQGLPLFFVLGFAAPAESAPVKERALASARVHVGDLVEGAPPEIASIDLGPTPVPGSTRLIKKEEIEAALPAGTKKLKLPSAIRIARKTRQLGAADIESLAKKALARITLPKGATVKAVRPKAAVTVPDGFDVTEIDVPRPPRKEGKHTTTATLTLKEGEAILAKLSVTIDLELSAEAATPDAKKGERGVLVVRRGLIEIKAAVSVNEDADVGDVVHVTVGESSKVLKGRLASAKPATFEEVP